MAKYPSNSEIGRKNPEAVTIQQKTLTSQFDGLGKEKRKRKWVYPKRDVSVVHEGLTKAQIATLYAFYMARSGSYEAFSFFLTLSNTYTGEYVGTGDAATLVYDLPSENASSYTIYNNSVAQSEPTEILDDSMDDLRITLTDGSAHLDGPGVELSPLLPSVTMTAASSGSTGITVADDPDINFGTGDFTLVWRGSMPDWTAANQFLTSKFQNSSNRWFLYTVSSQINFYFDSGGARWGVYSSDVLGASFAANSVHEIVLSVTRETAAAAGTAIFYFDGVLSRSTAVTAAAPLDSTNTGVFYVSGTNAVRSASTTHFVASYNRALSAAEVLDLYGNGIAFADKWGSQTALTSGTLTTGKRYRIDTFVAGDDFTNVGGTNESGNIFVATGTTPTTWANGSSLRQLGATLALEHSGIEAASWTDSANSNDATYPAAGATIDTTGLADGLHYITLTDSANKEITGTLSELSGTGIKIVSARSGATQNWRSKDTGFDEAEASHDYKVYQYQDVLVELGEGADGADRVTFSTAPNDGNRITYDFTGYLKIRGRFAEDNMTYETFYDRLVYTGLQIKGLLNDE